MFLTRLGHGSKAVITGDETQVDLPPHKNSGLIEAHRALKNTEGIAIVEFSKRDVVRHPLVQRIIAAYEDHRGQSNFSRMNVIIANRQRTKKINRRLLKQIANVLLAELEVNTAELGINIVAEREMTSINETFLQHEGSTDVITFDHTDGAPGVTRPTLHGELFVCVDEAVSQAKRFKTNWQSEIVRYIIHGILHLLGHDDHRVAARHKMKREENRLCINFPSDFRSRNLPANLNCFRDRIRHRHHSAHATAHGNQPYHPLADAGIRTYRNCGQGCTPREIAVRGKTGLILCRGFSFTRSRRSELHNLREVSLRETHSAIRQDMARLQQAAYAAGFIEQATETDTPLPGIYRLLCGFLDCLCRNKPTPKMVFAFELQLLHKLGLEPDWSQTNLATGTKKIASA